MAFELKEYPRNQKIEDSTYWAVTFPKNTTERINEEIAGTGISFSSFVRQACAYALDEMEQKEK